MTKSFLMRKEKRKMRKRTKTKGKKKRMKMTKKRRRRVRKMKTGHHQRHLATTSCSDQMGKASQNNNFLLHQHLQLPSQRAHRSLLCLVLSPPLRRQLLLRCSAPGQPLSQQALNHSLASRHRRRHSRSVSSQLHLQHQASCPHERKRIFLHPALFDLLQHLVIDRQHEGSPPRQEAP